MLVLKTYRWCPCLNLKIAGITKKRRPCLANLITFSKEPTARTCCRRLAGGLWQVTWSVNAARPGSRHTGACMIDLRSVIICVTLGSMMTENFTDVSCMDVCAPPIGGLYFPANFPAGGKLPQSYIALISMAILSSAEKRLALGDIYKILTCWLPDRYNTSTTAWRNSIRHNLSLNECFVKAGRAGNGKGNDHAVIFYTLLTPQHPQFLGHTPTVSAPRPNVA